MRRIALFLMCLVMAMAAKAKVLTVSVTNPGDDLRWQLVEVSADEVFNALGAEKGKTIRVKNARGQQVAWQLTYDGKLLIETTVMPHGTATFTIDKGTPDEFKTYVAGRKVPERLDDFAWENDRSAYRVYGPALAKTGERAFGVDVWAKSTPELVNDGRYAADAGTWDRIHAAGIKDKAVIDSMFKYTSFHLDHGDGLDCYKVGPSLGCGTPAVMIGDSIIFPYCYKDYEILDNGPLRITFHLIYPETQKGKYKKVVEHRIISLDKGSNYNRCEVWYEGIDKPFDVASGVVIHTEDKETLEMGPGYVIYADPTDEPKNNFQLFVGAVFTSFTEAKAVWEKKAHDGIAGHALGIRRALPADSHFTYYFGSAWSKADCRSMKEWRERTRQFLRALEEPLQVKIAAE